MAARISNNTTSSWTHMKPPHSRRGDRRGRRGDGGCIIGAVLCSYFAGGRSPAERAPKSIGRPAGVPPHNSAPPRSPPLPPPPCPFRLRIELYSQKKEPNGESKRHGVGGGRPPRRPQRRRVQHRLLQRLEKARLRKARPARQRGRRRQEGPGKGQGTVQDDDAAVPGADQLP